MEKAKTRKNSNQRGIPFSQKQGQIKLIFVYNADSGLWNGVKDLAVKTFNPSGYQCNLCGITYGFTGKKRDWKRFVTQLDVDAEFLHKDELFKRFEPEVKNFPCAYVLRNGELSVFIDQQEMDSFKTLEELKRSVSQKLENL